MYITFKTAPFNYERLLEVMPPPSGVQREGKRIVVSYCFETRLISGKQMLRVGLIKKSIEMVLDGRLTWQTKPIPCNGTIYTIDRFFGQYARFRSWPKWMWPRHRKELMTKAIRYAKRLHENGLLHYEAVLGAIYEMNRYMKGRIGDFGVLEEKARYIMAKSQENIESGKWKRLESDELRRIRAEAGGKGGKASAQSRQRKAIKRREQVKRLVGEGVIDPHSIAERLNVTPRTIYNDLKVLEAMQ